MATAISVTGTGKPNSFTEWARLDVQFDDGTSRVLQDVTLTTRQLFQLVKNPADYEQIIANG